ncbi:unnamed protein product [Pedinophyceae sp. YPF-701]|nr:unnamed protein product [Pedinophyceae sp. YPF-701]
MDVNKDLRDAQALLRQICQEQGLRRTEVPPGAASRAELSLLSIRLDSLAVKFGHLCDTVKLILDRALDDEHEHGGYGFDADLQHGALGDREVREEPDTASDDSTSGGRVGGSEEDGVEAPSMEGEAEEDGRTRNVANVSRRRRRGDQLDGPRPRKKAAPAGRARAQTGERNQEHLAGDNSSDEGAEDSGEEEGDGAPGPSTPDRGVALRTRARLDMRGEAQGNRQEGRPAARTEPARRQPAQRTTRPEAPAGAQRQTGNGGSRAAARAETRGAAGDEGGVLGHRGNALLCLLAFRCTFADALPAVLASPGLRLRHAPRTHDTLAGICAKAQAGRLAECFDAADAELVEQAAKQALKSANNIRGAVGRTLRSAALSFHVKTIAAENNSSAPPQRAFTQCKAARHACELCPADDMQEYVTFEQLVVGVDGRLYDGKASLLRLLVDAWARNFPRKHWPQPEGEPDRVTPGVLAGVLVEVEAMCTPERKKVPRDRHAHWAARFRHMFDRYVRPLIGSADAGRLLLPAAVTAGLLPGVSAVPAACGRGAEDEPAVMRESMRDVAAAAARAREAA